MDNLSTGRLENIKDLQKRKNFSFIKEDITKSCPQGFDYIVHGASIPAPDEYMIKPVETMLSNSIGLLNCLESARKSGSIVLYLSTSEVYGDADLIPTPESYWGRVNPIGPRSCYDESKRFGEALCISYIKEYGVDVRIARIFNTYGPRMDPDARYARVIPKFIMQALKNEPITVHGDGKQTRSFCYISDMVIGLLKLMTCDCRGEVVNLGSDEEITIIELANLIKELTSSSSNIVFLPKRDDDPRRRKPDISKAKKLLGWEPTVPLREGLKRTVDWFRGII